LLSSDIEFYLVVAGRDILENKLEEILARKLPESLMINARKEFL
jgi:hypothetical protein